MTVKLRLKPFGKKKSASYRLIAIDSRSRRDGKPIEELGFYNPRTKEIKLDETAIIRRLEQGAQPTDTVRNILAKTDVFEALETSKKNPLIDNTFVKKTNSKTDTSDTITSQPNIYNKDRKQESIPLTPDEPQASEFISVWITDKDEEVVESLTINICYNINFMVGAPKESSLTIDAIANEIQPHELTNPSEIDSRGLETKWIVSSSTIQLETNSNRSQVSIKSMSVGTHRIWLAQFPLFIPINGNSEIIKLMATPLVSQEINFEILIYARGEIFRQFEIHLDAEGTTHVKKTQIVSVEY